MANKTSFQRLVQPAILFLNYQITVDYDQTVEQMIRAGKYDWFNDNITSSHFPSAEKGKAQAIVCLVNFDRNISSEDAIQEMDKLGLRPVTLKELLALGATHSDLQRKDWIVALGSKWRDSHGRLRVPYLGRYGSKRGLFLVWFAGDCFPYWRFATVCK